MFSPMNFIKILTDFQAAMSQGFSWLQALLKVVAFSLPAAGALAMAPPWVADWWPLVQILVAGLALEADAAGFWRKTGQSALERAQKALEDVQRDLFESGQTKPAKAIEAGLEALGRVRRT